jgi:arsenate reductase
MTTNVLILCTHNSARSVLAEGMLNHLAQRLGADVRAYQLLQLPLETMSDPDLQAALAAISRA